jgi:hypothetical protein
MSNRKPKPTKPRIRLNTFNFKNPNMKPLKVWFCFCDKTTGSGNTPHEAYKNWAYRLSKGLWGFFDYAIILGKR